MQNSYQNFINRHLKNGFYKTEIHYHWINFSLILASFLTFIILFFTLLNHTIQTIGSPHAFFSAINGTWVILINFILIGFLIIGFFGQVIKFAKLSYYLTKPKKHKKWQKTLQNKVWRLNYFARYLFWYSLLFFVLFFIANNWQLLYLLVHKQRLDYNFFAPVFNVLWFVGIWIWITAAVWIVIQTNIRTTVFHFHCLSHSPCQQPKMLSKKWRWILYLFGVNFIYYWIQIRHRKSHVKK